MPLIIRVLERVTALRVADRVVVATDSEDIAERVRAAGGEAMLTSSAHPSGTDRIAEVVRDERFAAFDAVLNVQGDEPFVSAAAVRAALELVTSGRFPLGTCAVRAAPAVLARPDVVKVVTADDGAAMYFSRAPIPFLRDASDRSEQDGRVLQHLGVYAYTRDALARWVSLPTHPYERTERLEQLRPLAAGIRMGVGVVTGTVRGGIDTEADLERANNEWTTFTGIES